MPRINKKKLKNLLNERVDLSEVNQICFDLSLDYENIRGETKVEKIQGLLNHLEQRSQLEKIAEWLRTRRPDISEQELSNLVAQTSQPASPNQQSADVGLTTSGQNILPFVIAGSSIGLPILWWFYEPGFEPLLAIIGGIAGILLAIYVKAQYKLNKSTDIGLSVLVGGIAIGGSAFLFLTRPETSTPPIEPTANAQPVTTATQEIADAPPTDEPTQAPIAIPTDTPVQPTATATPLPTETFTPVPTLEPTFTLTLKPTIAPTTEPNYFTKVGNYDFELIRAEIVGSTVEITFIAVSNKVSAEIRDVCWFKCKIFFNGESSEHSRIYWNDRNEESSSYASIYFPPRTPVEFTVVLGPPLPIDKIDLLQIEISQTSTLEMRDINIPFEKPKSESVLIGAHVLPEQLKGSVEEVNFELVEAMYESGKLKLTLSGNNPNAENLLEICKFRCEVYDGQGNSYQADMVISGSQSENITSGWSRITFPFNVRVDFSVTFLVPPEVENIHYVEIEMSQAPLVFRNITPPFSR